MVTFHRGFWTTGGLLFGEVVGGLQGGVSVPRQTEAVMNDRIRVKAVGRIGLVSRIMSLSSQTDGVHTGVGSCGFLNGRGKAAETLQ